MHIQRSKEYNYLTNYYCTSDNRHVFTPHRSDYFLLVKTSVISVVASVPTPIAISRPALSCGKPQHQ